MIQIGVSPISIDRAALTHLRWNTWITCDTVYLLKFLMELLSIIHLPLLFLRERERALACLHFLIFSPLLIAEQVKNVTTVPTLQFVLFLFMQHLHKINLRSSLVSPTEEYPSQKMKKRKKRKKFLACWRRWTWTRVFGPRNAGLDLHLQSTTHKKMHAKSALIF